MTPCDNNRPEDLCAVTREDREMAASFYQRHLSRPGEVPVAAAMRVGHIDESPLIQSFARHRFNATTDQSAEIARLRAALVVAEDAMREMFRYYDGGETRGSYDGKPERAQLRKAWHSTRTALNTKDADR